mgnify:CR=1 FL=1
MGGVRSHPIHVGDPIDCPIDGRGRFRSCPIDGRRGFRSCPIDGRGEFRSCPIYGGGGRVRSRPIDGRGEFSSSPIYGGGKGQVPPHRLGAGSRPTLYTWGTP